MKCYSWLVFTNIFLSCYECSSKCCDSVKDAAIDDVKKFLNEKSNYYINALKKAFNLKDADIVNVTFKVFTDEALSKAILILPNKKEVEAAKIELDAITEKNMENMKNSLKFNEPCFAIFPIEYNGEDNLVVILEINKKAVRDKSLFIKKVNEFGGQVVINPA